MIDINMILENAKREVALSKTYMTKEMYQQSVTEAFKKLYYYQEEGISKIKSLHLSTPFGQVILPTASGKDTIMNLLILSDMVDKFDQKNKNYAKFSHRLSLNVQLLVSIAKNLPENTNIVYVGTGSINLNKLNKDLKKNGSKPILATNFLKSTSSKQIKEFINKDDNNTLFIGTYHSLDKVANVKFELVCFDEAHTIVSQNNDGSFTANLEKVVNNIKNYYFFTATQKVYGVDAGMNNKDLYGPVIYTVPAIELIKGGYIASPRFHIIDPISIAGEELDESIVMQEKTIIDSYKAHDEVIAKDSACHPHGLSRAKMLVNSQGSDSMKQFICSENMINFSKNENVKIFFIASHEGIKNTLIVNGEVVKLDREDWMDSIRNLKRDEAAIIFHIRILTEGIDLPNITGVLFTHSQELISFLQSIGRCLRRTDFDRKNILHDKTVSPEDKLKQEKPYGYVILPHNFLIDNNDYDKMLNILVNLVTTYDIPIQEMMLRNADSKGIFERLSPEGTNLKENLNKKLKGIIKELEHSILDITGEIWDFDRSVKVADGEFAMYKSNLSSIVNNLIEFLENCDEKIVCLNDLYKSDPETFEVYTHISLDEFKEKVSQDDLVSYRLDVLIKTHSINYVIENNMDMV